MTNAAGSLLASGAVIWLGNVLVFSLIYWLLDSGGPLARYCGERAYPDFAFSQQLSPELAPPGWRAKYVDYLILGLTTSTAFSPTDVMPMTAWAKLTMALQSIVSLTVVGLVHRPRRQRLLVAQAFEDDLDRQIRRAPRSDQRPEQMEVQVAARQDECLAVVEAERAELVEAPAEHAVVLVLANRWPVGGWSHACRPRRCASY